jgi:hypothetical protein
VGGGGSGSVGLMLDTWRYLIHPVAAQCNLTVDAFLLLQFTPGPL